MNIGAKYFRVEQSEENRRRAILCGATSEEHAIARLNSTTENMLANHWRRTDADLIKKLATVVILTDGKRTITLAVKECEPDAALDTKRELADMPWLVQSYDLSGDEDTRPVIVDRDMTPDDIYNLRDGLDDYEQQEGVGV